MANRTRKLHLNCDAPPELLEDFGWFHAQHAQLQWLCHDCNQIKNEHEKEEARELHRTWVVCGSRVIVDG